MIESTAASPALLASVVSVRGQLRRSSYFPRIANSVLARASAPACPAISLGDILASRKSALMVKEVAEFLNVSQRLIYDQVSKGRLPSFRVGDTVRFDPHTLAAWMSEQAKRWFDYLM